MMVCLLDDICQPAVHASDIRGTMSEYKAGGCKLTPG